MAINLNKYRENLQNAWKDVLDDKTDTNWALFGYEGQTNDLKVVGTGSDGLQELTEEFNSGKIMYAFVKIDDPKTSLPKCVLINWQGEGANTVRKGICANHLRDIEKFFSGAHLTINARNEDEVDADLIIQKVSKVGSAYSFKNRVEPVEQTKPVGTNYKRVNPIKEINAQERDQFWMREEQEEKIRLEEEYKKRELERRKLEEDIKQREIEESLIRDARTKERNNSIDQVKQAEKIAYEKQKSHEQSRYVEDVECKVNRSDLLRQERKKEAQELIGKRTIDARSIFEQNTSAGQIKKTPEKPIRASILKAQSQIVQNQVQNEEIEVKIKNSEVVERISHEKISQEKNFQEKNFQEQNFQEKYQEKNFQEQNYQEKYQEKNPQEKIPQKSISQEQISQLQLSQSQISSSQMTEEPGSDDDSDQFATIKRSPKDIEKKNPTSPIVEEKNGINVNKPVEVVKEEVKEQPRVLTEQQFVDEVIYGDLSDPGYQARALYDYQAADDTEITFDPGDVITHIEFVDEGWWQGLGPDGTYGLFPANYVELIQE